ncbi:MAG: DUF433 domain-containing protein [Patescibacteria group bacterium]
MAREIVTDPKILAGKPVIKGTRIPVYLVLNLLANGYTPEKVLKAYPQLTKRDVQAALEYAQARVKYEEEFIIPEVAIR